MIRLINNDKHFGPITYGTVDWNPVSVVWSSGDDDSPQSSVTVYALGKAFRVNVPNIIKPLKIKHTAKYWDNETIKRLGRNWYYELVEKRYGFMLNEGFLQVFYGEHTNDSTSDKSWGYFLPWMEWRFVERRFYDLTGKLFATLPDTDKSKIKPSARLEETEKVIKLVPKAVFEVEDFDGNHVKVTTYIEEREWRLGNKWFKWLSMFVKPLIKRSLDIEFSEEVGKGKTSWKGGLISCSIEMLSKDELHESAFRRYCNQEHKSRSGEYKIKFIGYEAESV